MNTALRIMIRTSIFFCASVLTTSMLFDCCIAQELKAINPVLCGIGRAAPYKNRAHPTTGCEDEIHALAAFLKQHIKTLPKEHCIAFEPQATPNCEPNPVMRKYTSLLTLGDSGKSQLEENITSTSDKTRYQFLGTINKLAPATEAISLLRCLATKDPHIMLQDQAAKTALRWAATDVLSSGYLFCNGIQINNKQSIENGRKLARKIIDTFNNSNVSKTVSTDRKSRVAFKKPDDPAVGSTAILLGVIGKAEDIPRLRLLLNSTNEYNIVEAAKALIMLSDTSTALGALRQLADWQCEESKNNYYPMRASWLLQHIEQTKKAPLELWQRVQQDYRERQKACYPMIRH